ncbi:MAG: ferredoxin-type protein NapF [Shewanella sp.]
MAIDAQKRRLFRRQPSSSIRPPFSRTDADFTDLCNRCQLCIPACETGILIAGDGGFVEVDFTKGECTFCGKCQQACEAPVFNPEQAKPWSHLAVVAHHCLAFEGVMCQTCRDNCDVTAIRFDLHAKPAPTPHINPDLCNGCGACVASCPVQAITMKVPTSTD